MARFTLRLTADPFDPGAQTNDFLRQSDGAGAAVGFTGLVRSTKDMPVESLTLETYPALADRQIRQIGDKAIKKFALLALTIIHRHGTLRVGEPIVLVLALAPHRQAAFDGANFVMDRLKTDAPFWKKQHGPNGAQWIAASQADRTARDRWE